MPDQRRSTTRRSTSSTRSTAQRIPAIEPDPADVKPTRRQLWLPVGFIAVGFLLWYAGLAGAYGSSLFLVKCVGILLATYGIVTWARVAPAIQLISWGALLQAPLVINTGALLSTSFTIFSLNIVILPLIGLGLLITGIVRWVRSEEGWLTQRH